MKAACDKDIRLEKFIKDADEFKTNMTGYFDRQINLLKKEISNE
jgi:hypothetical protein